MKKLICEFTYIIGEDIYSDSISLWLDKIDNYEIRFQIQEYVLKKNNKAIVLKIQVNIVEQTFNLLR